MSEDLKINQAALDEWLDRFFKPTPIMRRIQEKYKDSPKPTEEYTGYDNDNTGR